MENLRMEHRHGWHLSDPFLHLTSGPASAHLSPLSSASPPPEKSSIFSFPLSVLSGPRASPLLCKSESEESPHLDFVSLSRIRDEPARNVKEAMSVAKDGLHRLSLNGSNRGGGIPQGISCDTGLAMVVKEEQGEGANITSLQEDEGIGLKLGKRIYYEDAGADEAAKQSENSSGSSKSGSSSSTTTTNNNNLTNKNGGLRKKHRGPSSSNVAPKCLVEGCNADLSGAKDYHRRHKVCEQHSKASVSKVAGLEQRFCQQCSRFHVLSEFDEGKRSCRRRLAGHNERRRKPPPEPVPLLSAGTLAYLADSRFNAFLMDHPHLLQQPGATTGFSSGVNSSLASKMCLAGFLPEEAVGSGYKAPEPHRFMQSLPPGRSTLGVERALMAANRNVLSLSGPISAASQPTPWSVTLAPNPQPSSEMAISGCALSLLSSSMGSSSTPCTMSMPRGMTSSLVDQLLVDTHTLPLSRQTTPNSFSSGLGIVSALDGLNVNFNEGLSSFTNSSSGYSPDISMPQSPPSFQGVSMLPGSDFQSGDSFQRVRPMLDLMQISPSVSQQQQQGTQTGLHGLSIFNRQTMI